VTPPYPVAWPSTRWMYYHALTGFQDLRGRHARLPRRLLNWLPLHATAYKHTCRLPRRCFTTTTHTTVSHTCLHHSYVPHTVYCCLHYHLRGLPLFNRLFLHLHTTYTHTAHGFLAWTCWLYRFVGSFLPVQTFPHLGVMYFCRSAFTTGDGRSI